MDLIINLYQLINKYKEIVSSITNQNISLNEALIIHSIDRGKGTQSEIVSYLEKNRSQIHRLLVKLTHRGLLKKNSDAYFLTPEGIRVSRELNEITSQIQKVASEKKIHLQDLGKDVKTLKETLTS